MSKVSKTTAAGCAMLLGLAGAPVAAQDSGWTYNLSAYLWATDTTVAADTPFGRVESELSFSDAIKDLKFGFMGTLEARRGPWGFLGDLLYFDLETEGAPPGPVFTGVTADTKVTVFSGYALYRVQDDPVFTLDLGVGLRVFSGDVDITFAGPITLTQGQNNTWVDPLVAARMRVAFNENWFGTLAADVGATSDTRTYNVLATVDYQMNENWVFRGGWRYLRARWDTDYGRNRLEFSGPILGATYRF
jgi:hypothetical protein